MDISFNRPVTYSVIKRMIYVILDRMTARRYYNKFTIDKVFIKYIL